MGTVISTGTPAQIWTDQYINDLAMEAEIEISTKVPCIYVRFPLNVTLGQSIYDFQTDTPTPQRLTGIIRITWQGFTVYPVFQSQLRNVIIPLKPEEGDISSFRPTLYMRLGYGTDGIKFFSAPNASIAYDSSDINTQSGIRSNVIVSGWRIADPTGTTYRIPDYIRETLVRYYVMSRAFRKEGKGQNLDAAKYFADKYERLLVRFRTIVSQLFAVRLHGMQEAPSAAYGPKPPRPQLPSNFGYPLGKIF